MNKRNIISAVLIGFSLVSVSRAQLLSRVEYLKKFDERANALLASYDTLKSANYTVTAARYGTRNGVEIADSLVMELLKRPRGAMFWMVPVITNYIVGKDVMSPECKAAIRNAWKTYAPSRGDTENHWAMYYSALFLAAEQWPDLPGSEWYNGKSSEENRKEAKEYLFDWAKLTTTKGQGEFDSPDYIIEYLHASTILAGFAQDKDLKLLGEMLSEYFLADFAVEHLNQQYGGGHSRIYENKLMEMERSVCSGVAALYFLSGEPRRTGWMVVAILTGYKMPEIIYQIANDREKSYVHRERKRVRHNIRFGKEKNPAVYKYTYMTKDYVIGSLMGGLLQPIQQHTWSVRYNFGKPHSIIFGLHPYWSCYEIGMFFPTFNKLCMDDIVSSKKSYNKHDKWTGGSPNERTFQHKNTLIALYDVPLGTTSNHIDAFFPANLQERIIDKSGWIFCKAGDTYVAWYPLQPGEWNAEYKIAKPAFAAVTGSRVNDGAMPLRNYRFRSWELQNGYVVEVRSKDEIGSFKKFTQKLRSHIPLAVLEEGNVSVAYKNLDADKMEFSFPDGRQLNGEVVDLTQTPLFAGPFLNADVDSQLLEMQYPGKKRILDFKKLEIREE